MFENKKIDQVEARQAMEHVERIVNSYSVINDCIKDIRIQINQFKPLSDGTVATLNNVIDCLETAQIHLAESII